jgi:catechol 2,3-dioxygenase-like lactoylglutathione lyase family enzyme
MLHPRATIESRRGRGMVARSGSTSGRGFAVTVGAEPAALDGRVSPAYLYVRVEDVRATVAALEEAGGRPLSPLAARDWGEEAAWFADPDGNVVAVAQMPASPDS